MKKKQIIVILCLAMGLTLSACGGTNAEQTSSDNIIEEDSAENEVETEDELEYAIPDYGYTESGEEESIALLPWTELAALETHPELRSAFEELIGIGFNQDGDKYGILYSDGTKYNNQNNTLLNALGNLNLRSFFVYHNNDKLTELAYNEYTNIDDADIIPAVFNAYYELLPDLSDGEFNGSESISRAQAMTLVMRAVTPVNEAQAPDGDSEFTDKVGESQYTDFAAEMNDMVFISTSNGLNEKNFNSKMSRAEYIYMLVQTLFGEDYSKRLEAAKKEDESLNNNDLTTIKDAGDITLSEAIKNPENGLPSDMYQTLARAVALGFIDESSLDWDKAITKSEAITLFIDAAIFSYSNSQFGQQEFTNEEGLTVDEEGALDNAYLESLGFYNPDDWIDYAHSQGADGTDGVWWIYNYGGEYSGNTGRSYAINQRTGQRIEAGPNSYLFGGPDSSYSEPFFGSGNTFPGEEYSEWETNLRKHIGIDD